MLVEPTSNPHLSISSDMTMPTDLLRRTLLKSACVSSALVAALTSGMLKPVFAFAAERNQNAFEAKDLAAAIRAIDAANAAEHKSLQLNVPDIAEDGASVPIDIVSAIPNTSSIAVLVEKNPFPLAAFIDFANGAVPEISLRVKIVQTSMVKVIAKADGKSYIVQREIKVTDSACRN